MVSIKRSNQELELPEEGFKGEESEVRGVWRLEKGFGGKRFVGM